VTSPSEPSSGKKRKPDPGYTLAGAVAPSDSVPNLDVGDWSGATGVRSKRAVLGEWGKLQVVLTGKNNKKKDGGLKADLTAAKKKFDDKGGDEGILKHSTPDLARKLDEVIAHVARTNCRCEKRSMQTF